LLIADRIILFTAAGCWTAIRAHSILNQAKRLRCA
jgi:hypothetical protein